MTTKEQAFWLRVKQECALPHGTMFIVTSAEEIKLYEIIDKVHELERMKVL